jgi:hypothetical protein
MICRHARRSTITLAVAAVQAIEEQARPRARLAEVEMGRYVGAVPVLTFAADVTLMLGCRLGETVFAPCGGFRPPFDGIAGQLLQHGPRPVRG